MAAGDNRLAILAAEIRAGHAAIVEAASALAERVVAVGAALVEAKAKLPHGAWEPWLDEHAGFSARTARRYMRVVRLGLKTDTVAELGLVGALAPLAKLRPPASDHAIIGEDDAGWSWAVWRDMRRGGPWFHAYAVHLESREEVASIKPMRWRAIPGQLEVFGLNMAALRFGPPVCADVPSMEAQRSDVIRSAHPLWASPETAVG